MHHVKNFLMKNSRDTKKLIIPLYLSKNPKSLRVRKLNVSVRSRNYWIEKHKIENTSAETYSSDRAKLDLNKLTRFKPNHFEAIYEFLQNRDDFAGIQLMYHNVEGLSTHLEEILTDPCFMQSDLILLSETGTIQTDHLEIPGFKIAGAIDSNEMSSSIRKKCGVIIYIREGLVGLCKKGFKIYSEEVQILICYVLNNVRFAVMYASPQVDAEYKLDAIMDGLCIDEDMKTVLMGNFNIDFNSLEGREFTEALRILDLELRTNPKHYTSRDLTTTDAIFSNKSMRTGVYMTTYGNHMALYGRID